MSGGRDLDPHWALWIAGNLARGRPAEELVEALRAEGHADGDAARWVAELDASPGVAGARLALRPVTMSHRLRRDHLRLASRRVPVRRGLDGQALYDEYIATQQPVILPDLTADWPALRWTWEGLVERLGDREIRVCEGRTAAEEPARRWRPLVATRTLRAVIERVLDPATGDDLYVTANNEALEGPLSELLADVRPIAGVLVASKLRASSAWIGPAGTRTPAHHDVGDILFCQILGRKRVWLAPPEEVELAEAGVGYFGPDVPLAEVPDIALREVVVEPGDSLLIPAGWWHEVVALTPSLTLTFAGFAHPNDSFWYRPAPPDLRGLD